MRITVDVDEDDGGDDGEVGAIGTGSIEEEEVVEAVEQGTECVSFSIRRRLL